MTKKTLSNKSENPEQPLEMHVGKPATNLHIVGEDMPRAFYKCLYLSFCVSSEKALFSKDFTRKLKFLYENNCNYISYKFSNKFTFIPFLCFRKKPKKRIKFSSSWWSRNKK